METLKEKISRDLKTAMKNSEAFSLSTLRMLWAAISNKEIELRKKNVGLSDQEVLEVIAYEAKKRKDAAAEYKKGGREDLAKKEEEELLILSGYLPPELGEEEIIRVVKEGIREAGAAGEKDFGKVMKIVMPTLRGKASGDKIAKLLKEELDKL